MADEVTGNGATDVDAAELDGAELDADTLTDEERDGAALDDGAAEDAVVGARCLVRVPAGLPEAEVRRVGAALGEREGDFAGLERVGAACVDVGAAGPGGGPCWFE